MNAVGIDISKGKSMVTIMRPLGEIVASPFEVNHTTEELNKLAQMLKSLDGETKIVMECTGSYHLPIAHALDKAELFVSAINPLITHNYNNNSIRKSKNDKADAIKIASYALSNWLNLPKFIPEEDARHMLKVYSRQYTKYKKVLTMLKNNLISLLDCTFPGANELFTSQPRKSDGHEKWVDFVADFWHCKCISSLSEKAFVKHYRKWCKCNGYNFSQAKAETVYINSIGHSYIIPMTDTSKLLITQAVSQINAISETINTLAIEMKALAASLPEYPIVMEFRGVGDILGPQLIAEIGDIGRYVQKSSLVRYAGLEPVENQSGKFRGKESISKQGSPHLRRALFLVMDCLLKGKPAEDPIFSFIDRKRAEGKHYRCYMCAGAAKFLRVYYARVTAHLNATCTN
jgi:transposase